MPFIMNVAVTTIFFNTISMILFFQTLRIALVQCIRRQALHPPIAPEISPPPPPPASSPVNTHMETQAAISKAIHPHCHHTPGTRPLSNKLCLTATCYSGQSNNTIGGISKSIYRLTIPYLSTWLLLVQALLGMGVTMSTFIWHTAGFDRCHALMYVTLVGFHAGLSLLFMASAVQTHLANKQCIKIFFIVAVGVMAHFVILGLEISHGSAMGTLQNGICLVDIMQPTGWLGKLPMYTGLLHFLMSFLSAVSFINGSFGICSRSRFRSSREISFVMMIYKGLGLFFSAWLLNTLLSAVVIGMAATGNFHYGPVWALQWALVSRCLAAALWHRGNTDGRAHLNVFWSSDQYLVWHPVATEHDIWRDTPSASYYFMVVKSLMFQRPFLEANDPGHALCPVVMGGTVASYTADCSSNHNTVFNEIIHCTTCTCGVQH